jgi:hypothetical protein
MSSFAPWFCRDAMESAVERHLKQSPVIGVEVEAVRAHADDEGVYVCEEARAEWFSVYLREDHGENGKTARCVADVADRATAEAFAAMLGRYHGVPVQKEPRAAV